MAIANLGLLGSVTAVSAGSQLLVANTTGATIPSGTVIHITGTWDNIASVTAPTITCTSIHGTAATNHATAIGSGVTTTAGAGIWHQCFRMVTIDDIVNGGTIAVLDSNQLAVKRAAHAQGSSGALDTLRGTVATGTSTTGSPSVATAGTALVAGDLVVGSVSFENSAQMTADADTLNGSWSAIVGTFTTGGAAGTNVGTGSQGKIVTAPGAQTFNPTGGSADTVACVYSLVPLPDPTITQASYRFYADGTESGLVDGYDETNVSVASSAGTAGADYGQSFLGNGGRLSRARFWLSKTVAPTGNVTARLYAHTGTFGVDGTGTGSPLATATSRSGTSLQSTAQWEYFDFDGTFTLAAGTPYVIALTIDSTAGGAVGYGQDNTTPTHAGSGSSRTTGAWFTVPTADMIFGVYSDNSLAAQDTAYTADLSTGDANLLLRTRLQSTNAGLLPATDDYQLQYEKNASGSWVNVAAGDSVVVPYDSPSLTEGAATTNRLGAGTGSFTAGKVSEDGLVDNLGWPSNNYTELLYALTFKKAGLANGDTLRFRVLRNAVATGLTYTQVPTVTAFTTPLPTSTLPVFTDPAWTVVPPATATATVVTGAFPGVFAASVTQIRTTAQVWTLDSFSFRLLGLPTGVSGQERVYTGVYSQRLPSISGIRISWFGDGATGYLDVNRVLAGASTRIGGTPAWDSATPYLRMRLAGPTVFIERSADAVTWTLHGSMDHGLDLSHCQVIYETNGTSAATPTIDQLNVTLTTRTGRPKVWTGSAWANKPAKVWTGSAWVEKPVKVWSGTAWVPAR